MLLLEQKVPTLIKLINEPVLNERYPTALGMPRLFVQEERRMHMRLPGEGMELAKFFMADENK